MKTIFMFVCMLCTALIVQAQTTFPMNSAGKITYEETITVSGSKDVLYARAQKFATGKYKFTSLKKAEHTLTFTAFFPVTYPGATTGLTDKGTVNFSVTVSCKDGKYHYTFTDFNHLGDKGKGNGGKMEAPMSECGKLILPKAGWEKIKSDTPAGVERFKAEFIKAMEK